MERERVAELLGGAHACLRRAATWLGASPAETLALGILLAGAALVAGLVWWLGTPRPAGRPPPAPFAAVEPPPSPEVVTVHVAGAVRAPGLARLPKGARVADALDAAGGALPDAALDGLNLARTVGDGEQVVVPRIGGPGPAPGGGAPVVVAPSAAGEAGSGAKRPDGRLDINRATPDELEQLPGVGPVLTGPAFAQYSGRHGTRCSLLPDFSGSR